MRCVYEYKNEVNGDSVQIVVYVNMYASDISYSIHDVLIKPKGKRKFISQFEQYDGDYEYRHLDVKEKDEYIKRKVFELVGEDRVIKALNCAYLQLKPDINSCLFRI